MSAIQEAVVSKAPPTGDVESDAFYQVRLIHGWPPTLTSPSLDKNIVSSFYGLQLELRGTAKSQDDCRTTTLIIDGQALSNTTESRKITTAPLLFGSKSPPSPALLVPLDAITGPFQVVIIGKVPAPASTSSSTTIDEEAREIVQQMNCVQVDNTLLEINGERFLVDAGATGADVYRRLWLVASRASLATPYELTLRRHNLAHASAKIVPFAKRKDVQDAQMAQLPILAAQETALPLDIRLKKLFLMQQLDFEREHVLAAYLGGPLQELHTRVMGDGKWQAFEYGKTLWYFHAPTGRLYAQHPLRNLPEARELIKRVQEQVLQAVRRLQRRTRSYQRRQRLRLIIQAEMHRQAEEKLKEHQRQQAVRRIQRRMRTYQRRQRLLATLELEKRRQEELQREQQQAEAQRREEQQVEDIRQMEVMQQDRRRLQHELDEMKLELQRLRELKETRVAVQMKTQTSGRRHDDGHIELFRKEEQQRVQERLEKLELPVSAAVEFQTQTSSRCGESDADQQVKLEEQQRAHQRIEDLELKLQNQSSKVVVESVTQTSSRSFCDEGVGTGDDLEWQRYLTLLRVAVKNKRTKVSPKSRHTQTESIGGEATHVASSMLRAPQNVVPVSSISRKSTGEWNEIPSWHRGSEYSSSNSSSSSSLVTLKSSVGQFDELDTMSPPPRTFESFFSRYEQPPPPLVEHPWRQDSTYLPLKSSRTMVEITPQHQPFTIQLQEYQESIRPIRSTGTSSTVVKISPSPSPTKLPYITRRRNK